MQVRHSSKTPLLTCLLEGKPGVGKTALAATVGINSDFPFVKVRAQVPTKQRRRHQPSASCKRSIIRALFSPLSQFAGASSGMTCPASLQVISAENYVGWSEAAKCAAIAKVFDDAYKVRPHGA